MKNHIGDETRRRCVLIAEDDTEMRRLLAEVLAEDGFDVRECVNGFNLLENLGNKLIARESLRHEAEEFDLIISDIRMPGVTGLSVLEGIHMFEGFPPMILITAFGDEETHARAKELGAVAVFDKPFEMEDLLAKVHEVLDPVPH